MRVWSTSHLREASDKCKWNDDEQLTVLCNHIVGFVPNGDFDRMFDATKRWAKDSGLHLRNVKIALCFMIDEHEAESDFKGEKFADYLNKLVEASGADTATNEKKKPEKGKGGKGGARKKAADPPKDDKKGTAKVPAEPAQTGQSAKPTAKSKPAETKVTAIPDTNKPEGVQKTPLSVIELGSLSDEFCAGVKEWLLEDKPLEVKLGALMAREEFPIDDGTVLYLDAINGRPKLGIDMYVKKDGKSVANLDMPVREYRATYEITYNGKLYRVRTK